MAAKKRRAEHDEGTGPRGAARQCGRRHTDRFPPVNRSARQPAQRTMRRRGGGETDRMTWAPIAGACPRSSTSGCAWNDDREPMPTHMCTVGSSPNTGQVGVSQRAHRNAIWSAEKRRVRRDPERPEDEIPQTAPRTNGQHFDVRLSGRHRGKARRNSACQVSR